MILLATLLTGMTSPSMAVNLADQPVFTTSEVPGNVALALSVEYPTAIRQAHTASYSSGDTYLGYFDSEKCYTYVKAASAADSYFDPAGLASSHACTAAKTWSGNFLNWATTQTIDPFRWAMTGGYRVIDTPTQTILQKAYHDRAALFGDRSISGSTVVGSASPFTFNNLAISVQNRGIKMVVQSGTSVSGTVQVYDPATSTGNGPFELTVRVKVCVPGTASGGVESNCKQYGSNWKPEGLIQQYASKMRFSAFGYLNEDGTDRDGGVMRARQKFVGPLLPVPGQLAGDNGLKEWSATDGTYVRNPDPTDAGATSQSGVTIEDSGVINYLNKFGQLVTGTYKSNDPVSELYYTALRYYRNLGPVTAWNDVGSTDTATVRKRLDAFPVVKTWDDPIQYSCQRNFILGIGDIYTHADKNVPGNTKYTTAEKGIPNAQIVADTSVNAITATNKVGQLQGLGNTLGETNSYSGRNNSAYIAGLAYDANTKDIRPDVTSVAKSIGKQTVQTYWVDVLEAAFEKNNQFYLAAKFGGLNVPSDFSPYTAAAASIQKAWWSTNGETVGSGTTAQDRPDNYFTAGQPDTMIEGLTKVFASIANTIKAFTTSFSLSTAQVSATGSATYASQYDSKDWSGVLTARQLTFATDGTPSSLDVWTSTTKLATQLAGSGWDTDRRVVTWDGTVGVAFRSGSLTATQRAALDTSYRSGNDSDDYIKYLRGDRTHEDSSTVTGSSKAYRTRTTLLGDIVNAKVTPVAPPSMPFAEASNAGYAAYKSAKASRPTMVYAGSNDGMLHAFNGALTGTSAGVEQFAYIPSALFQGPSATPQVDGLAQLGSPNYVHHYYVDATPLAFDVDFNRAGGTFTTNASGSNADWRTILIGGLGKGGKSFYALDISNPQSMTTESAVASKVLWEFTDPTMGSSFGPAVVVKTRKHGWIVVLTSGYNNSDGRGYLYFVDPRNGQLREKVSTGTAAPGLAYAAAYVQEFADNTADAIYAGDLNGNVWRFDVSSSSTTDFFPAPVKLATLADNSGNAQPITTAPRVEINPVTRRRFVLIGTGQLLAPSDVSSNAPQSFYGLLDGTAAQFVTVSSPITRSQLIALTDPTVGISLGGESKGWYMDLGSTSGVAWRLIASPEAYNGVVAFAPLLTSGDACSPSGLSRAYVLNFNTGKTVLNSGDGYMSFNATVTDMRFVNVDGTPRLIVGDNQGGIRNVDADLTNSARLRLMNWREIPVIN